MTQIKPRILDQFKDVTLYTWDSKSFQVDVDSSCIFNSLNEESAWSVFEDEAQKRGSQYVKDLTKENLATAEIQWQQEWTEYMKNHPDADCFDYADEREAFMMSIFGGDAKHL